MSKSAQLRYQDGRALYQLIGECHELGDDRIAWRSHWIAQLARLTDSDLGHTGEMADCRKLLPKDLGVICWGWQTGFVDPSTIESQLEVFRQDPEYCPTMIDYLRRHSADDGVCHSRKEIITDRAWYASPDYEVVQKTFGVDHILWCFRTIPGAGSDVCSGIVLNREKGRANYCARDRAIIREANHAISGFIGGPLARFTDPSPLDLAPRVRQVLACMLEGDGDKQIAKRLALSAYTVNQYSKSIFKHFCVRSRTELLARWIRRGWSGRFPWAD